ncbi:MAG: DUF6084 family protein [Sphingomicrobium sp.]
MPDLRFSVEGVEVEPHAVAPTLLFKVKIANATPDVPVQNVQLQCQLRIEPTQRGYDVAEHEPLSELFGTRERWTNTLHSMLWAHTAIQVPGFSDETIAAMPVPCSFDFNVAATKYFDGLDDGDVALTLLFSGTIFYRDGEGRLQMDQIAWSKEASYRLPVRIWRDMMEAYYPDSAWLRINRASFDALARYKRECGFTGWEQALDALLDLHSAERVG